jgi:hypothetical protein
MFKFKIAPNRHNAIQNLNYCLLPDPPLFSLPSTFKGIVKPSHKRGGGRVERVVPIEPLCLCIQSSMFVLGAKERFQLVGHTRVSKITSAIMCGHNGSVATTHTLPPPLSFYIAFKNALLQNILTRLPLIV